jgi:4-amino-4-deoxychorismate lyase
MFVESIRILKGKPRLINYHNSRLNTTCNAHYVKFKNIDLKKVIEPNHLDLDKEYKCRVMYNESIISIDYQPYHRRDIRSLKIVYSKNPINYTYKKVERPELDVLYAQMDTADEIIIVNPNGFISDAYYYNIILEKEGLLFTPDTNLLNGVMRTHLLSKGKIQVKTIHIDQLHEFEKIYLINALNPLGMVEVDINNVIW